MPDVVSHWLGSPCMFRCLPGFPGGRPGLFISDSIAKAAPRLTHMRHEVRRGYTISQVTAELIQRTIRVGGLRVIAIHMGTNNMDARAWVGQMSTEERLQVIVEEFRTLYRTIRRYNATAFLIFISVLPRKCDWEHTQFLYQDFNNFLCKFARQTKSGYLPFWRSFIYKEGPLKGRPRGDYLARNDGGLHLNIPGRHVFGERVKAELSVGYIRELVRRAKFSVREASGPVRDEDRGLVGCRYSAASE